MMRCFWKGVGKQDGFKGAVKSDVLSMVTRHGTIQMEDTRKHFLCFVVSVLCRFLQDNKHKKD